MKLARQGKISFFQPDWAADAGIQAGFTTRNGGVSRAPFNSLNLGTNTEDQAYSVEGNRSTFSRAFGLQPRHLLTCSQVHGMDVLMVNEPNLDLSHFQRVEADAIITNQRGVMAGILVADCYPVILFDAQNQASAVVHVGWQGAAGGILGKTIGCMTREFGTDPSALAVAVGPGIGAHNYEVDRPVRDAFEKGTGNWRQIASEKDLGKWQLDLQLSCRLQLEAAGIPERNCRLVSECTCCHKELFFSYRRDKGVTGRQMGFVLMP